MRSSVSIRLLMKACLLSVLFFVSVPYAISQEKGGYNLLWEISGKGLKKPSYLFGSIHLKDKRAFNFSDEVMKAIASSSAYVMELHPDTMSKVMIDMVNGSGNKPDLWNTLTKAQQEKLMERYKLKYGVDGSPAILGNPFMIYNVMEDEVLKTDDMPTFVDTYLYGISKTLKKKVFGLEKSSDQLDLFYQLSKNRLSEMFDRDRNTEKERREKLIELYSRGSLEAIAAELKADELASMNVSGRNQVMFQQLVELMKTENLFVTVGAAHLPGKEGIINLLKKAGYQVKLVPASFTGLALTYKPDRMKMDVYEYTDTVHHYKANFPAIPVSKNIDLSKSMLSVDLTDMSVYGVTATYTGNIAGIDEQEYLDAVLDKYKSILNVSLVKKEEFFTNGAKGVEADFSGSNRYVRVLLFHRFGTLYMLTVSNERDVLHHNFVNGFFDSFEVHDRKPISTGGWVNYKNITGAFSVKFPVQPEESILKTPNNSIPEFPDFNVYMYAASDEANQVYYLVKYNDFPEGSYLDNRNLSFRRVIEALTKKGKIIGEPETVVKSGYEGILIKIVVQGYYLEALSFFRGNRSYVLLRQHMKGEEPLKPDEFFDSFVLEQYAPAKGIVYETGGIKTTFPVKPLEWSKERDDPKTMLKAHKWYYAVDAKSGAMYALQTATLSKYYRNNELDSLYRMIAKNSLHESDSLYQTAPFSVGQVQGKEFYVANKDGYNFKRFRLSVNGNQFYTQVVVADKADLDGQQVKSFFEDTRYEGEQQPFDMKASKVKQLMEDLKSSDTLVSEPALNAARHFYFFNKDELNDVYEALKYHYNNDTLEKGTRSVLLNEFYTLKDEETVPFLKSLYADTKNPDYLRSKALHIIPEINHNLYDWYVKTLQEGQPLKLRDYEALFKPLRDSLSYVAVHLEEILPLLKTREYRPKLLSVLADLAFDTEVPAHRQALEKQKVKLYAEAPAVFNTLNADDDQALEVAYVYLSLLGKVKDPVLAGKATDKILRGFKIPELRGRAAAARILNGLPVDPKVLQPLLDSLHTRFELMSAFHKAGKLESVPLKYRMHGTFAKLLMYERVRDDYGSPQSIQVLGGIKQGIKTYYAIAFTYETDEGKNTYIGISGPFGAVPAKLEWDKYVTYTNYDLKEEDWRSQAKKLIAAYEEE